MPRRVAVPVLRPPLDLCLPTGVRLGAGARVVVAGRALADLVAARLAALGATPLFLDPRLPAAEIEATLRGWLAAGPVTGLFWLPALEPEPALAHLDLATFREHARVAVKNLATAARVLYDALGAPGSFLCAATRLSGLFGLGEDGCEAPLGGAVAGFVKALKRERRDALVKVVDVAPGADDAVVAEQLVAEVLADPGAVEVGRRDGQRWTVALDERPVAPAPGVTLDKDTVFVVTGAAGGITSAIVADLAAASGGTFHLLDLVAPPPAGDPHVALFRRSKDALKDALIAEAKAAGKKPLPAAIDREILAVERAEAALRTVEAVRAAGGTARWHALDLRDGAAVAAAVGAIRAESGRIDVLVHAGGIEISRNLPDKTDDEWAHVFDIKADGLVALLAAARDLPLGATVVFSSVAGRFGNAGQTDYSAANALLCAISRALPRQRPGTRAVAIDWTAWGGIGMATRGSIPKIMEAAGIDVLDPRAGVPTVRRELLSLRSDEIVVGGRLGILVEEWQPHGGLDLAKVEERRRAAGHPLVMVGRVTGAPLYGGLTVETTLDPAEQPFLHDHQIEGVPVLPGVMGTEAFAEVASLLCPDLAVAGIEDLEFLLPFKFHRMKPTTLYLTAVGRPGGDGLPVIDVRLTSTFRVKPDLPAQERLHFRARVVMGRRDAAAPHVDLELPQGIALDEDAIYRVYFHGPAYHVLQGVQLAGGKAIGVLKRELPPNASPADSASLVAPRLVELCFQTAGILDVAQRQVFGLPAALRRLRVYDAEDANGQQLYALVEPEPPEAGEGAFDARVVDEEGNVHLELSGYRTVALPGRLTLDDFRRTRA